MNDEARNKIRSVIKETVNPILDRRVNIFMLHEKVVAQRRKVAEEQQKLKQIQDILDAENKKDVVEFEALIDLISISGWKFSTTDSHDTTLTMIGGKRTAENSQFIGAFVNEILNRFVEPDERR